MKENSKNWVCTDPDSCQYRRTALELDPNGDVFELIQIQASDFAELDEEVCLIAHDWVYYSDIDEESVLDCYGYRDLDEVKKQYGEDWKGILAECQFELDAGCMENIMKRVPLMTYDGAKKFIEKFVEENT